MHAKPIGELELQMLAHSIAVLPLPNKYYLRGSKLPEREDTSFTRIFQVGAK